MMPAGPVLSDSLTFVLQGDEEAAVGLKVSDFCNRSLICMPKAQLFFIEKFMRVST